MNKDLLFRALLNLKDTTKKQKEFDEVKKFLKALKNKELYICVLDSTYYVKDDCSLRDLVVEQCSSDSYLWESVSLD